MRLKLLFLLFVCKRTLITAGPGNIPSNGFQFPRIHHPVPKGLFPNQEFNLAIVAGILILAVPRALNYVVAVYLTTRSSGRPSRRSSGPSAREAAAFRDLPSPPPRPKREGSCRSRAPPPTRNPSRLRVLPGQVRLVPGCDGQGEPPRLREIPKHRRRWLNGFLRSRQPCSQLRAASNQNPFQGGFAMNVSSAIARFFEYQRANCKKISSGITTFPLSQASCRYL